MLTDAAAIGFSLVAIRLAARPAQGVMTYGLKRVEILSAQANGVTLLVLALLIPFEGIRRLIDPPDVEGGSCWWSRSSASSSTSRPPGRSRARTAGASTSKARSSTS